MGAERRDRGGDTRSRTLVAPDGRTRTFRLVTPDADDGGEPAAPPRPLVVALHGGGDSALGFHLSSGLSELAVRHGFVLAYPDGTGDIEPAEPGRVRRRSWNAGRCCGAARRDGVDDLGFVDALVEEVASETGTDPLRRYAVGHSNGGMLAFRLALERPGLFVGIGVQSASIAVDAPGPSVATHLMAVHGGSDRQHPIDGGRGPDSSVESPYGSVREACARFAAVEGAEVELVEVPEGTHSWMGLPSADAARHALAEGRRITGGIPFAGFDTAGAIWEFLARTPPAPRI